VIHVVLEGYQVAAIKVLNVQVARRCCFITLMDS